MAAPDRQRPEGPSSLQKGQALCGDAPSRNERAEHHHHRRVHRPSDDRPAVERRPAPGGRGQEPEGVKIKEETQTLATITLQNFFKLYKKLCGMTGTAMTEADEFWKIYKLDVIAIPTNKPLHAHQPSRRDLPHREGEMRRHRRRNRAHQQVGRRRLERRHELVGTIIKETAERSNSRSRHRRSRRSRDKIEQDPAHGRPMLVGTVSIEKSERLARCSTARHQARGAQRQASPARGRDRRPGRPHRRRDHRHEHGRPRHRHHPGRQPGNDGLGACCKDKYATRLDVPRGRVEATGRRDRAARRR